MKYERFVLTRRNIVYFIIFQFLLSIGLIFLLSTFLNTPKESRLKQENSDLQYEIYMMDKKIDGVYYMLQLLEKKDSVINHFYSDGMDSIPTPESVNQKLDNIYVMLKYSGERFKKIIKELTTNNDKLRHYPAIQPVSKKDQLYISSGFSMRIHPIYKIKKFHYGIDFVAEVGTPIYATADGTVTMAQNYHGYGNFIKIDHGYGYSTAYGHLDNIGVRRGQKVVRGEIIGTVGNTGISTGPHLHYEVIYNNKPINPINFFSQDITAEEYEEMLRVQETLTHALD
jgi:hypothetical protein